MTPIEIIALIFIIIAIVKLLTVLTKPKSWINVTKKVWFNPLLMAIVSLILAAIVLYYLLQSGMTIIQILAVAAFIGLVAAIGIAPFVKDIVKVMEKLLKQGIMKKAWLSIIIWIILVLWGLKELFM